MFIGSLMLRDWVVSLRPKHWLKNVFVLAPVLFSEHFGNTRDVLTALAAFALFCPLTSALYLLNDVVDRPSDARHPHKQYRPITAGRISARAAILSALALLGFVAIVSAVWFPPRFSLFVAAYFANTLAYIVWLKNKVILDVLLIAIGFVIRLEAGCAAIAVEPTHWLLVCGFSLALVLGFGKRRTEIAAELPARFRPTLFSYDAAKLNTVLGACTAVCLVSYMLFTVAPETVARHGTDHLVYTVPIVAYGLFRYLFKVMEGAGDGPTEILVSDPIFACTGLIWGAAVLLALVFK